MKKGKTYQEAQEVIRTLEENRFYTECPCGCGEEILLRDANLFYLDDFNDIGKEAYKKILEDIKIQKKDMKKREKQMSFKSEIAAQSVNIGFIMERLAPTLKSFPFEHYDCRSLFDPIDYVIFEGLHNKGIVTKIVFTDIKTGNARLKSNQKEIKELVNNKKVALKVY
jgi:predicted Holliday junction resolvase-like endonuclease